MNSNGIKPKCDEFPLISLKMTGICQSCGKPVRSGAHFCSFCGASNTIRAKETGVCPSCGSSVKSNAHFCYSCGDSLRISKGPDIEPHEDDIALKGQSDTLNKRFRTVIKVVDVGRVLNALEPPADEGFAGIEFFPISVYTDVEDTKYITDADLLFIVVDSSDEAAVRIAGTLAQAARNRSSSVLMFSVVLYQFNHTPKTLARLEMESDALIAIPHNSSTFFHESVLKAFSEVLHVLIQCVAKLLASDTVIGVDFEDFKALFTGAGKLFLGIGVGAGEDRSTAAVREALDKPVTERLAAKFRKVLVYLEGNDSFTLSEFTKALKLVNEASTGDALIVWGAAVNPDMGDSVKVIVIAA